VATIENQMPGGAAWLTMAQAKFSLQATGKLPEEAATILMDQLVAGRLSTRAARIRVSLHGEELDNRFDHPVPTPYWSWCPLPPLGHAFWTVGDIQFLAGPPDDEDDLSLTPPSPTVRIWGLRLYRDGVLALCRAIRAEQGKGRPKGAGSYAALDAPLLREMRRLRSSGEVTSITKAAERVAERAAGGGTFLSKTKRLVRGYKAQYPATLT
jgi:hypothetical protein